MALGFGNIMADTTYQGQTVKVPKPKTGLEWVTQNHGDARNYVSGLLNQYGSFGSASGPQIGGTAFKAPGATAGGPNAANTFGPSQQWTSDTDRLQIVTNLARLQDQGYVADYFNAIRDQNAANPLAGLTVDQILEALENQGQDGSPIYIASRQTYGDTDAQGNPTGANGQPPAPGMTSTGAPMPTVGVTQGTPGAPLPGPGGAAPPPAGGTGTPPPGATPPPAAAPQNVEDRTVAGRLRGMLAEDSPLMQEARTEGLRQANRRGLANSSIAVGASQREMIRAATPIATADANLLSTEYMQRLDLENREKLARLDDDTKRYVADLNANTQVAIKNMDVGAANQKAASDAANNASARYTSAVINVMSNPDIPADQREAYLTHYAQMFDSDMRLIEGMYNVDLAWSSPTGGGTAAPTGWNEQAYLAANPDVAAAVQNGQFASGADHYQRFGRQEIAQGKRAPIGGGGTAPNPSAPAAAAPSGGAAAGTQAPAGGGGGGVVPGLLTGPNAGILDQGGSGAPEGGTAADVTYETDPETNRPIYNESPDAYDNAIAAIAPLYGGNPADPGWSLTLASLGGAIAGQALNAGAQAVIAGQQAAGNVAAGAGSLSYMGVGPGILVALPALFQSLGIGVDEVGHVYPTTIASGRPYEETNYDGPSATAYGPYEENDDPRYGPFFGVMPDYVDPTDGSTPPTPQVDFSQAFNRDFAKMVKNMGLRGNPDRPFVLDAAFTVAGDNEGDHRDGWAIGLRDSDAQPIIGVFSEREAIERSIALLRQHGHLVPA